METSLNVAVEVRLDHSLPHILLATSPSFPILLRLKRFFIRHVGCLAGKIYFCHSH